MRKKLLSLALVLAMALTLAPAALAAGQFTDVPDTSPFAAPIAWAVEKQITNGVTPTTFGPKNTCTTSHILTFLWRANGRPGDAGDEKAAVTAWANGLGIDTSDLAAPCTRANAVTYMWKAAGSPAPAQTASFTDVAADAPYASAVSWAVEKGVTKGTSDTAFSPYDTCTRGQIVTFLCRQLDPEAAKAQPAATQPEAPAAQADTPETVLAAVQGVWREENADGSIQEYLIEGNTLTSMWSSADGKKMHYATAPIQLVASGVENCYDVKIADGVDHPRTEYNDGVISVSKYGIPANVNFMSFFKVSDGRGWVKNGGVERSSSSVLVEKINHIKELENQQQEAISKYPTLSEFPMVPDFGAIYGVSLSSESPNPERSTHSSHYVRYKYDREEADARAKALLGNRFATAYGLSKEYADILMECGYEKKSAKSIGGDYLVVYENKSNGYTVQLSFTSFCDVLIYPPKS